MSTYAIGDLQGCHQTFRRLLDRLAFDPAQDSLWLAGDLVNRGTGSLAILRDVRALGPAVVAVLGNHDVHFLRCAFLGTPPRPRDTLDDLLQAPDREELVDWLRRRPVLHRHGKYLMVHAGLLPSWTADEAATLAHQIETELRGDPLPLLSAPVPTGDFTPGPGLAPLALALAAMTTLRTCTPDGVMVPSFKGPPEEAPAGALPWYQVPTRRSQDVTCVVGHWAALGLHYEPGLWALDSGGVWGRCLTAVRLEDGTVTQEPTAPGDRT